MPDPRRPGSPLAAAPSHGAPIAPIDAASQTGVRSGGMRTAKIRTAADGPWAGLLKFCRLKLGMKPVIDYIQSRQRLLGIADLPIRTVFDVGANVGRKARHYRRLFPDATIYCFEPVPACYQRLEAWARRQDGKVRTFALALSDHAGETAFYWNTRHSGGSSLLAPPRACRSACDTHGVHESASWGNHVELTVRVERLDDVANSLPIQDEVLVKIDVEGCDLDVIRGGRNMIGLASAVIVEIALHEAPVDGPNFFDFARTLQELGYMYRGNLAGSYVDGIPRLVDAVFIKPPARRQAA